MTGELAVGGRPNAQPVGEHALHSRRDADERRDGRVAAVLAEERPLELDELAVERVVVPVEAAARTGNAQQEVEQDGAEERLVLRRVTTRVRSGVDGGSGLASKLLERDQRVVAIPETAGSRLDELADERSVLVERRPVAALVLLERKGSDSPASSSSRRRYANAPSVNARSTSWSCGAR